MASVSASSHIYKTSNGTNLHYTKSGDNAGRLIVCLHGLGGSTETFKDILPFLTSKSGYSIICTDAEGSGKTALSSPDVKLSIPRYVSDLDDLISFLQGDTEASSKGAQAEPVILIGHSLGSIISLHYAAHKPKNTAGLALLGVGRSASKFPGARDRMLGLAAMVRSQGISAAANTAASSNFPAEGVSQSVRDAVRELVGASPAEGYAKTCEAVVDFDTHVDPDYSKIRCPTLFISGKSDPLSPASRAKDLEGLVGGDAVLRIVGQGHQPILEDRLGVESALDELFAKI